MNELLVKLIRNQTGLDIDTINKLFEADFEFVIHDGEGVSFFKKKEDD